MTELDVSGERVIEDAYAHSPGAYVIYAMHVAAYAYAEAFCRDADVLDFGCGSGYRTARLVAQARSILGVDVDADAVAFARERYGSSGARFEYIKFGKPLPFADASFDVVLSFQVIEHVEDDASYIREACRVVRPGGVFIVVTPDRANRLLPGQRPWNRWHLREYSLTQLRELVAHSFEIQAAMRMGAPWDVAQIEIRRYRRVKWLTLPFTLPGLPEAWRRRGLDMMHALRGKPRRIDASGAMPRQYFSFDHRAFLFAEDAPNSLNVVVVGRKPHCIRQ